MDLSAVVLPSPYRLLPLSLWKTGGGLVSFSYVK